MRIVPAPHVQGGQPFVNGNEASYRFLDKRFDLAVLVFLTLRIQYSAPEVGTRCVWAHERLYEG